MSEKFEFDIQESLDAIKRILQIAEKYEEHSNFSGLLSKNLLALKPIINTSSYISKLNKGLITCRNYHGLELVRAWDGGFSGFAQDDDIIRLHRLALFLVIYLREQIFRGNYRLDQGNNFYFLNEIVRRNRDEFVEKSSWCLDLLDDLPTLIMQEEFHSEHAIALSSALKNTDIKKVEEFIRTRDESISKIDTWNNEFQKKNSAVEILKDKLDTYQTAFNFVGLYQGFSSLLKKKSDELDSLKIQYFFIGLIIISIPLLELAWVFDNLDSIDSTKVLFIVFPTLTLLFVLFWFFRIVLHNIKSVKSQIMQLELRMTLCQFIQSYAEKSKELKEANKEGFEKFENIIFSSIVSSDENIPSTFDGMEHVSNLLKNFKSNP